MNKYIKFICIVFCFFISLIININGEKISHSNIIAQINNISNASILNPDEQENSIVYSNTQNHEISSINNDRKNLNKGNFSDKTTSQNKTSQQLFKLKYNQIYWSISHKISPYLKNEICARAP